MQRAAVAVALVAAAICAAVEEESTGQDDARQRTYRWHGFRSSRPWKPRVPIPGAVSAETLIGMSPLPRFFDWRDVGGKSLVVNDWNQHIPQYCGSCWIHGTTMALTDRIKVYRQGAYPDIILGRQAILNCVPDPQDPKKPPPGCDGGDAWMIHEYLMHHKVPDETCMPYQARNMGCEPENVCRNCFPGTAGCFGVKHWVGYGVSSYGSLSGEDAMMREIYARGPIACSFATDDLFMLNFSAVVAQNDGHVYYTGQNFTPDQIDHVMEVVGWGETTKGLKYWVVRNSWGTYWGEAGWFKLRRGTNELLSESDCDWAVPAFDDLDAALAGRVMGDYVRGASALDLGLGVFPIAPLGEAAADIAAVAHKNASNRSRSDLASIDPDERRPRLERRRPPRVEAVASPKRMGRSQLLQAVVASFLCGGAAIFVGLRLGGRTGRAAREAPFLG